MKPFFLVCWVTHEKPIAYNEALIGAAMGGRKEIVERLLQYPKIEFRGYRDQAITGGGHVEIFKLFLADPRVKAVSLRHAYWWASRKENAAIMELLKADGHDTDVPGRLIDCGG